MADRGMKKWNAYKSLPEQFPVLDDEFDKEKKIEKPILTSDKEEEINEILTNYRGQLLEISIFKKDKIIVIEDRIKKIDVYEKKLMLVNNGSIKLFELVDLKVID